MNFNSYLFCLFTLTIVSKMSYCQSNVIDYDIHNKLEKKEVVNNRIKVYQTKEINLKKNSDTIITIQGYNSFGEILYHEKKINDKVIEKFIYNYDTLNYINTIVKKDANDSPIESYAIYLGKDGLVNKRLVKHYGFNQNRIYTQLFNYYYDENKKLVKKTNLDSTSNYLTEYNYEYNNLNNIIFIKDGTQLRYKYNYDEKDNLYQIIEYHSQNLVDSLTIEYEHDQYNRAISEKFINNRGKIFLWQKKIFDINGQLIQIYLLKRNGKILETTTFKYLKNSNLISQSEVINSKRKIVKRIYFIYTF